MTNGPSVPDPDKGDEKSPQGEHYDFTGGKPAIRRDQPPKGDQGGLAQQGRVWAIGANLAFMVMGGGVIGWLLQTLWLKTAAPWPLLIGLGAGMAAGMIQFIREALKLNR